ncbi:helix-turn-helix domain-containing protein [Halovivax limisalsi]|uniref:helix-turn-helix domain-containing protein n=1 Tax=Halovivax limisalsi TaxID=1453760 RepID=UPI001FFDB8BA|nr:helix-turn-helix domain-containing protein [Halovivax limisalsi]
MSDSTPGGAPGRVVEIELRLRDPSYPFVGASDAASCRVALAKLLPRPDDRYAEYFTVSDDADGRIETAVAQLETVSAARLETSEGRCLYEFLVSGDCPAVDLAKRGALPRQVIGDDGQGRIVAEVPARYDAGAIMAGFLSAHPDAAAVSKREKASIEPLFARSAIPRLLRSTLTDRQREVLEMAFEMGYYDWPRRHTGSEIADRLGISSATFSEHISAAERKLLAAIFEDGAA